MTLIKLAEILFSLVISGLDLHALHADGAVGFEANLLARCPAVDVCIGLILPYSIGVIQPKRESDVGIGVLSGVFNDGGIRVVAIAIVGTVQRNIIEVIGKAIGLLVFLSGCGSVGNDVVKIILVLIRTVRSYFSTRPFSAEERLS